MNATLALYLVFLLSGFSFRIQYSKGILSDVYIAYSAPKIEHLVKKVVRKLGGDQKV